MEKFLRELRKSGGHILNTIKTYNGRTMIYYREPCSLVTDTKTIVF